MYTYIGRMIHYASYRHLHMHLFERKELILQCNSPDLQLTSHNGGYMQDSSFLEVRMVVGISIQAITTRTPYLQLTCQQCKYVRSKVV